MRGVIVATDLLLPKKGERKKANSYERARARAKSAQGPKGRGPGPNLPEGPESQVVPGFRWTGARVESAKKAGKPSLTRWPGPGSNDPKGP